jgi:hypothetical protein
MFYKKRKAQVATTMVWLAAFLIIFFIMLFFIFISAFYGIRKTGGGEIKQVEVSFKKVSSEEISLASNLFAFLETEVEGDDRIFNLIRDNELSLFSSSENEKNNFFKYKLNEIFGFVFPNRYITNEWGFYINNEIGTTKYSKLGYCTFADIENNGVPNSVLEFSGKRIILCVDDDYFLNLNRDEE